jgi:long-chain acyl-CoA synthetase
MNRLADLISQAGAQFAAREALADPRTRMTFAEAEADSNRLASALVRAFGLSKGERIAILLPNCIEFVLTDFALIKAGLIRVPVNPRYTAAEIEFILDHSGAAALVTCASFAESLAHIRGRLGALRILVTIDSLPGVTDALNWKDVLAQGDPATFAVDTASSDGYMLGYTSGTTGRPKGALSTVGARWATLFITFANEFIATPDDVMLHVASLAHGSGTKVLPIYVRGAKNLLLPKFSPFDFFQAVARDRVTVSWMVPTMVAMLADSPERSRFDFGSLSTIMYAGAPMPEPVMQRALAAFGPVFIQIYGLTEAPQPDLILSKQEHLPDPASGRNARAGVTGRVAMGVQLKLVDGAGQPVKQGEIGEIVIAGDHVMAGYWNDPAATAETLRDGWCHTGDLARMDREGFYTIVDRKKEMIISGGYNVYPREVEEVLYSHPAVVECAVIGAPDPVWGETVCALIVVKPGAGLDAAAISAHCARALASYKKPRRITFLDALPKTANGKIDKKALRAAYASPTPAATTVDAMQ